MSDVAPPPAQSPPPPPPPPSSSDREASPDGHPADSTPLGFRPPREGDVTPGWRAALAIAWLGVFFAYAATWQASVQLGLATWWIGPRSTPTPAVVRAIPFFVTIVGLLLVLYNVRRLSMVTFWLAAASVLIALPDFSTSIGLATLEVLISVSMMIVAAASLTGRYRREPADSVALPDPTTPHTAPSTTVDATAGEAGDGAGASGNVDPA